MLTKMISRLALTLAFGILAFVLIPKSALADIGNGIVKPGDGTTVTGLMVIRGIAYDPAFTA